MNRRSYPIALADAFLDLADTKSFEENWLNQSTKILHFQELSISIMRLGDQFSFRGEIPKITNIFNVYLALLELGFSNAEIFATITTPFKNILQSRVYERAHRSIQKITIYQESIGINAENLVALISRSESEFVLKLSLNGEKTYQKSFNQLPILLNVFNKLDIEPIPLLLIDWEKLRYAQSPFQTFSLKLPKFPNISVNLTQTANIYNLCVELENPVSEEDLIQIFKYLGFSKANLNRLNIADLGKFYKPSDVKRKFTPSPLLSHQIFLEAGLTLRNKDVVAMIKKDQAKHGFTEIYAVIVHELATDKVYRRSIGKSKKVLAYLESLGFIRDEIRPILKTYL